jgi:hypothetical protein
MSEKTTVGADLTAAGNNNTTSAFTPRKEMMPILSKVKKDLVSQQHTAILAYLQSFGRTKTKADPEAAKKQKKYQGRVKIHEMIYQERPADGTELEPEYDIKHVSFWTDTPLEAGQFVIVLANVSKKNFETKYFIKKLVPLEPWAKNLFEDIEQYMPTGGKSGAK